MVGRLAGRTKNRPFLDQGEVMREEKRPRVLRVFKFVEG